MFRLFLVINAALVVTQTCRHTHSDGAFNTVSEQRINLGKSLFFDQALSVDSSLSCASCHIPGKAFSDGMPVSVGFNGRTGFRNAPALFNLTSIPEFFRDGGAHTLELQVQGPVESEDEMAFNMALAVNRLSQNSAYQWTALVAYRRPFDAFVLTRSLAAFQKSLESYNSPYDAYLAGDSNALTASQKRGMELFFSERTGCVSCHSGKDFTDHSYRNIGLYSEYKDSGRAHVTHRAEDSGKFRVPTLRNLSFTSPYMHNGSFHSLQQVLCHYTTGGHKHRNKDEQIKPFYLSPKERTELIDFLLSLSDTAFVNKYSK
jgi:cytochrome c peroxidase